ncbi:hypothetical protein AX15_006506 [Amanita polypyramis BW_CC]|nr:hypothetical protein AX15_006506 [Amanita polypyramis BW_CC]
MDARKLPRRVARVIMKSHRFPTFNKSSLPIRLRPWFFFFTCIIVTIVAFLGFTNFSRALPINDKVLHFLCFALTTAVFYFIIDVEEEARRIWLWRHSATIFTVFVCFLCGSILSEVVQSVLPFKHFEIEDVFANILGSSVGLFAAYHIDRYYRYRREISRLYRPLDTATPFSDDEEEANGAQLLPTHNGSTLPGHKRGQKSVRLADPWDEREELFGIGDSDLEDEADSHTQPQQPGDGRQVPKITVTNI